MLVHLTREDVLRLAQIVRDETGNQIQEKNYIMIGSRMRSYLLKLKFKTMDQYWRYFESNEKAERIVLQSLMTTHYTFFFREYAHFEVLERWIDSESNRLKDRFQNTKQPVRVWSAACSRGQEVYSLAMFLEFNLFLKYGVPFEIVGTDIDSESISYARNGVYPLQEVNTIPKKYLNGYWRRGVGPIKDFAAVHPKLKERVKFEAVNLMQVRLWSPQTKFDVIFCRNVFIYFSEENVRKVALDLGKKLDNEGLFVSGMSEPLRFSDWKFSLVGPSCYQNSSPDLPRDNVVSLQVAKKQIAVATPAPSARYRVLCVDDSPTIQLLMKNIFTSDSNCSGVETASNGKEAREMLDKSKFDLITLDIHMPVLNGIEFLEQLYQKKLDPPVIMVSSVNRTDMDLATKALTLGACDYVEKPALNNLKKSSDEILTKAKLALKGQAAAKSDADENFDASISQKVVVPNASQCLRIVFASNRSKTELEQIVRGQKSEYRSPAFLIIWQDTDEKVDIGGDILRWSNCHPVSAQGANNVFKPNTIYLCQGDGYKDIFNRLKVKSISLQIVDTKHVELSALKGVENLQVLVDEKIKPYAQSIERQIGRKVSDITPATSFPSLSFEFFANLRKASA